LDQEERLDAVSDAIASTIGRRPDPGTRRFRPVDNPPVDHPVQPVEEILTQALKDNPALRAAQSDLEAFEARLRGARWDALPEVDLLGSIGGIGLAGDPQEVTFGDTVYRSDREGNFSDAWSEVFDRRYPTWTLGLEVSIPLGLREGGGERERLQAAARRSAERLRALRLALEEEVRMRHRELLHGRQRLVAAREGVDAAQEQVRIGLIEYRAGRTTAFELVRLGADLAEAQQRYSQALVRTAKAEAQLRRLTGSPHAEEMPYNEEEE
jgi:outer membrane protein TolC